MVYPKATTIRATRAAMPGMDIEGTGKVGDSTRRTQPRFALAPEAGRALTAPATSWIVPPPRAVRESMPEITQVSVIGEAAGFATVRRPVVQPPPWLIAMLVGSATAAASIGAARWVPSGETPILATTTLSAFGFMLVAGTTPPG